MQQQPTANSMNMAQMSPWGSGSPVPEETAMGRTEQVQPAVAARGGKVNIRTWAFQPDLGFVFISRCVDWEFRFNPTSRFFDDDCYATSAL